MNCGSHPQAQVWFASLSREVLGSTFPLLMDRPSPSLSSSAALIVEPQELERADNHLHYSTTCSATFSCSDDLSNHYDLQSLPAAVRNSGCILLCAQI